MTVRIICDSSQNVPEAYQESLGIIECPASIVFGDEVYLNKVEMSEAEFYRRLTSLPKGAPLPTTTQPTPRQFKDAIDQARAEGASEVIITAVSAKLSGTYNSGLQAAALERDVPVQVWDTASASLGSGWQTIVAAEMAQAGAALDEIMAALPAVRARSHTVVTVDTLTYLVAGGRLSPIQGLMGNLLSVKPILFFDEGLLKPLGRERGRKRARRSLIDLVQEQVGDRPVRVAVANAHVPEEAAEFAGDIKARLNAVEVIVLEIGPVLAALAGPGVIAMAAFQVKP